MSRQYEISRKKTQVRNNRKRVFLKKRNIIPGRRRIDVLDEINFVDKSLVHKKREENVHIYNLRRELPESISADVFENNLIPFLSSDEQNFLLSFYIKRDVPDFSLDITNAVPAYVLRNRLLKIRMPEMDKYLDNARKEEDKDFLLEYYKKTDKEDEYFLCMSVKEPDDIQLMSILNFPELHINDTEKMWISAILEKCDEIEKENIFFVNMHTDPGHDYFFEHTLDHAPGMMVIETARQFFVAVSHSYGNVPTSGIEYILSQLEVNLTDYLWLSYPVRVKLEIEELSINDEDQWNSSVGSIVFYQEHRNKGQVRFTGFGLPDEILDKIVNKRKVKYAPRPGTNPGLNNKVHLYDIDQKQNSFSGSIIDISPRNFMLEFENDIDIDDSKELQFNINTQQNINLGGRCSLQWKRKTIQGCAAVFRIIEMGPKNRENLIEITKRLRVDREINEIM